MINETISRYRIVEQLAKGALSVVYKAIDTALGRQVAIKVLCSPRRDYRTRFLREARAISGLSHPGMATVLDYGETPSGQPYIVMELIRGARLSEKLQGGSLPLTEAIRIVSTIAETLSEAHGHGFIHRDIKPSNVLLTERGEAKVVDFGLVKRLSDYRALRPSELTSDFPSPLTRRDRKVFVSYYLTPEQATGGKVDARTDLFALGVVMYECLTGRPPFYGANLDEVREQVCNLTPVRPSQINAQVPPSLDWTTMKAIEKKVEDRYQSANELIEELQGLRPRFFAECVTRREVPRSFQALTSELDYLKTYTGELIAAIHSLQSVAMTEESASSRSLRDLESEFDELLARMQTPKSKRAVRIAFQSSPAQLGRAAVRHARKQR